LEGFETRINALQESLAAIDEQMRSNRLEYREILQMEIDERRRLEAGNAVLKESHQKGDIVLSEFMKQSKTDVEIERIARSQIAEKVKIGRMAARDVSIKRLEILKDIEQIQSKMALITRNFWKKYTELLSREKANLEKFFSFGYTGGEPHRAEIDFEISKGVGLNAKNFNIQSWANLEDLPIGGLIQEKHFGEFDRMILDFRAKSLDFERHKLALYYRAGTVGGFPDGFTWNIFDKIRPGVVVG